MWHALNDSQGDMFSIEAEAISDVNDAKVTGVSKRYRGQGPTVIIDDAEETEASWDAYCLRC